MGQGSCCRTQTIDHFYFLREQGGLRVGFFKAAAVLKFFLDL
jgi:hypothetical protein